MTVAPHLGAVDPHVALGACCVYKVTHIETGKAYIGKTVTPLENYIKHGLTKRKQGIIGHALRKYDRAAFRSEILLVGTEDFCFRDVIDGKPGGMERRLIAAWDTQAPRGYNLTDGGDGFTSEDMRRFANSPAGREALDRCRALGREAMSHRAGYPGRRVLAELEKGPHTITSMANSLGLTKQSARSAIHNLRHRGHHIIVERASALYHLYLNEEDASDAWYGGPELKIRDRVLGLLMEGPRNVPEMAAILGAKHNLVGATIWCLRKNYSIESRGATAGTGEGGTPGTFHLIIDHKRHPWLHLGLMDWRGAAHDDRE